MTGRPPRLRRLLRRALVALAFWQLAACGTAPPADGPPVARGPAPEYATVAARYNERLPLLSKVFSPVVMQVTYLDEEGQRHHEQGEGVLQVVVPDHLALSLSKAGKRVFWLGGDGQRYWWIDLLEENTATVWSASTAARESAQAGLGLHPREIVRLLGIVTLPDEGRTQWSSDGRLLGLSSRTEAGGLQRVWADPDSLEPRKIELYGPDGRLTVVADLEGYQHLPIRGIGGGGPRLPRLVAASIPVTGTDLRLSLARPEGNAARISRDAFDLGALTRALSVARVVER
ncbi:MAG TPA: hypothetical protein VD963_07325 [Phycisphaerales bacterium]|nr:hypothetical protein [Phycisphaerales bacterium]